MRMYLSSFRLGDHPERLVSLMPGSGSVAVIANAIDTAPTEVRAEGVQRELDAMRSLDLDAVELDLRDYHLDGDANRDRLTADLSQHQAVWVRGGNVFVLRHALAGSGADDVLTDLVRTDALVYAGYSAGPCVLAPSLRGLEHCDDAGEVPATYGVPARWDGLGLLDYAIVPHIASPGHRETELLEVVAERYRDGRVPHRVLRDGQALVIDGEATSLV